MAVRRPSGAYVEFTPWFRNALTPAQQGELYRRARALVGGSVIFHARGEHGPYVANVATPGGYSVHLHRSFPVAWDMAQYALGVLESGEDVSGLGKR